MPPKNLLLMACALITSGCATSIPVAVSCPVPPPPPAVLTSPVSTEPSLTQQYEPTRAALQDSLKKAQRQP